MSPVTPTQISPDFSRSSLSAVKLSGVVSSLELNVVTGYRLYLRTHWRAQRCRQQNRSDCSCHSLVFNNPTGTLSSLCSFLCSRLNSRPRQFAANRQPACSAQHFNVYFLFLNFNKYEIGNPFWLN